MGLLSSIFLVFLYMCLWFVLALIKRDNSIADIAWGLGFVAIAWFNFESAWLLPILCSLWGIRLAIYLFIRNQHTGEDWRYQNWRKAWGKHFYWRTFLQVFMLQGLFMWLIALPLIVVNTPEFGIFQVLGTLLWLVGFLWESIADWQLYRFKRNPLNKGKVLKEGLWKYARHPNYFGEILVWWGIYFAALPNPNWWWLIISPLTITWLLARVSGVPMLERKYKDRPEYQAYVKNTPSLIPNFRIQKLS